MDEVLYSGLPPTGLPHTFTTQSLLVDPAFATSSKSSSLSISPNDIHRTRTTWSFSEHAVTAQREESSESRDHCKVRPLFSAAGVYAPGVSDSARVVRVTSGLVGEKTKFTFRSRCQHIFILIQVSSEVSIHVSLRRPKALRSLVQSTCSSLLASK